MKKKWLSYLLAAALTASALSGCASSGGTTSSTTSTDNTLSSLAMDNTAWQYNADEDVYWQIGVSYCENPVAPEYESLGIYVPAAYMTATDNGNGTYTCQISDSGTVNGYTATTAPIVMPINTPGYAAQTAPTEYTTGLDAYLEAGYIYVLAGCRGRTTTFSMGGGNGAPDGERPSGERPDGVRADKDMSGAQPDDSVSTDEMSADAPTGDVMATQESTEATEVDYTNSAPAGVTDLKSAIRYLRYNADVLPGDAAQIYVFGMSGGGAQSALVGVSGDSALYTPYLEEIGAAMTDTQGNTISDAVAGAMCWCPITSLDLADEAYEWGMGQYVDTDTRAQGTFTKELSNDMAAAFATYINALGLTSADGTVLSLEESSDGIYAAGTYYDYMISVIETSLNNFLSDTTFPYTPNNSMQAGFAGNAGGNDGASAENTNTVSYATAQEYIDSLNAAQTWITYDAATNTAKITSMAGFVNTCKTPSKTVGAFDALDLSAGENQVFGDDENNALHFDSTMAALLQENQDKYAALSGWSDTYVADYAEDITYIDGQGSDMQSRVAGMYNPMYYISQAYDGYGTATVAPNIRIRTGLFQGDTAVTVEANLALALAQYEDVNVDFETVWGLYHTVAERTGEATSNFVEWVAQCVNA